MAEVYERRQAVTAALFKQYDTDGFGELTPCQLQSMHASLRQGGISLAQVQAAMMYCCLTEDACEPSELFATLQELDRRYFLLQDFRWEFALLDRNQWDLITEDQARFMFEAVHGQLFSKLHWERFLKSRPVPGSGVSFAEIEVDLCNIPSKEDMANEEMEEQRQKGVRARQIDEKKQAEEHARLERLAKMEAKRLNKEYEKKKKKATEKQKEEEMRKEREEEQQMKMEEAQGKKEAEEREREEDDKQRKLRLDERERQRELEIIEVQQALEAQKELERKAQELEEQEKKEQEMAKNAEEEAELAAVREKEAEEEVQRVKETIKNATDAAAKKAAEEAEKAAKEKARRERNDRIRKDLKVAIKQKDRKLLNKSVAEFKKCKLADTDGDLNKAERILTQFRAKDDLLQAMEHRNLEILEKAINYVKKNSMEAHMPQEMVRANKMLLSLKRLKRLKDEILNLKQSTVAEIRSYNKPPRAVHMVMIATCLLLGNKEKALKDWKAMQALVGRTGKEGLKRRVLDCNPTTVGLATAKRTKDLLKEFDLEQVRDVSAGAAVFYAWASATIEEVEEIMRQKEAGIEPTGQSGGPKKLKHQLQSGTLTITI